MIWKSTSFVARWILCLVFLLAAWPKIMSPSDFAMIVYQYRMLPDEGVNGVALVLPWVEVVAALALVVAPRRWRQASAVLLILLLLFFTGVLSIKLYQGVEIHCGCFSTDAAKGAVIGLHNLIRNTVLLLLGVLALYAEIKLNRSPPEHLPAEKT